jgi:hypothetical protein
MSHLETAAAILFVLGVPVAIFGGRFRVLAIIAAALFIASVASIIGYVAWLRFGVPMSDTATCYDSTVIECGFGFGHNGFKLGPALVLIGFFAAANIGGLAIVWARRSLSRNAARI